MTYGYHIQGYARDVTPGDFLPLLDHGYVYAVETDEYGMVTIEFHSAEGVECTLTVPEDHPLVYQEGEEI